MILGLGGEIDCMQQIQCNLSTLESWGVTVARADMPELVFNLDQKRCSSTDISAGCTSPSGTLDTCSGSESRLKSMLWLGMSL